MPTIEEDLLEVKKKTAKFRKQVEDTEKGLKKLLKKVNGHDAEANTTGSDGDSDLVPGLRDRRGTRPQ